MKVKEPPSYSRGPPHLLGALDDITDAQTSSFLVNLSDQAPMH